MTGDHHHKIEMEHQAAVDDQNVQCWKHRVHVERAAFLVAVGGAAFYALAFLCFAVAASLIWAAISAALLLSHLCIIAAQKKRVLALYMPFLDFMGLCNVALVFLIIASIITLPESIFRDIRDTYQKGTANNHLYYAAEGLAGGPIQLYFALVLLIAVTAVNVWLYFIVLRARQWMKAAGGTKSLLSLFREQTTAQAPTAAEGEAQKRTEIDAPILA